MADVTQRLMTEEERRQYGGPALEWCLPGQPASLKGYQVRVRGKGLVWSPALDAVWGCPDRVRIGWEAQARALILRPADAADRTGWRVYRRHPEHRLPECRGKTLGAWLAARVPRGTYAAIEEPVGWVVRVQAAAAPVPVDAAPPRPAEDTSPAESWTDRVRAWARAHGGLVHVADAVEVFGQAWPESEAAAKHRLLALLAKLGAERVARGLYRLREAVDT